MRTRNDRGRCERRLDVFVPLARTPILQLLRLPLPFIAWTPLHNDGPRVRVAQGGWATHLITAPLVGGLVQRLEEERRVTCSQHGKECGRGQRGAC